MRVTCSSVLLPKAWPVQKRYFSGVTPGSIKNVRLGRPDRVFSVLPTACLAASRRDALSYTYDHSPTEQPLPRLCLAPLASSPIDPLRAIPLQPQRPPQLSTGGLCLLYGENPQQSAGLLTSRAAPAREKLRAPATTLHPVHVIWSKLCPLLVFPSPPLLSSINMHHVVVYELPQVMGKLAAPLIHHPTSHLLRLAAPIVRTGPWSPGEPPRKTPRSSGSFPSIPSFAPPLRYNHVLFFLPGPRGSSLCSSLGFRLAPCVTGKPMLEVSPRSGARALSSRPPAVCGPAGRWSVAAWREARATVGPVAQAPRQLTQRLSSLLTALPRVRPLHAMTPGDAPVRLSPSPRHCPAPPPKDGVSRRGWPSPNCLVVSASKASPCGPVIDARGVIAMSRRLATADLHLSESLHILTSPRDRSTFARNHLHIPLKLLSLSRTYSM